MGQSYSINTRYFESGFLHLEFEIIGVHGIRLSHMFGMCSILNGKPNISIEIL